MRWIAGIWLLSATLGGLLIWQGLFNAAALERLVGGFGAAGPIAYLVLYSLAPVLVLPGAPLAIAGGAMFGPAAGTLYALVGSTSGAALSFLVARSVARSWAERHVGEQLARVRTGVDEAGWRFVFVARTSPLLPYNLLNYALGLTRIGFVPYVLATAVGLIPVLAGYVLLGDSGRRALEGQAEVAGRLLTALAVLNLTVAVPWLVRRIWRGSKQR